MQPVRLINGAEEPLALVSVLLLSLKGLFKKAQGPTPEAISYMLALYDLKQLCLGVMSEYTGECRGCFGGSRQKLLDLNLVEGGPTGPLRVNRSVRNVVDSALNFNEATQAVTLDNLIDREGLHAPASEQMQKELDESMAEQDRLKKDP